MEILSTITALLSIAEKSYSFANKLLVKDNKKEVAELLNEIGNLLKTVAEDLKNNQYPHDKCAQLHFYMTHLKEVLANFNQKIATEVQDQLQEACQVEKMFGEYNGCNDDKKELNLKKLLEASGSFLAAGFLIKT